MATRCDCSWETVTVHDDLDRLWLRATDAPGGPAHSTVREDEGLTA